MLCNIRCRDVYNTWESQCSSGTNGTPKILTDSQIVDTTATYVHNTLIVGGWDQHESQVAVQPSLNSPPHSTTSEQTVLPATPNCVDGTGTNTVIKGDTNFLHVVHINLSFY